MLCRMLSRKRKTGKVPVYLNVYDITPINGYAYWLGLGVYHSGLQVEPKQCPGFTFRKSILMGRTDISPKEVHVLMEKLAVDYPGNAYNLITKNCNHFCNDACFRLIGKPIPRWVNRLARLGFLCNCVLPAGLNETKIRCIKSEDPVNEKKKLRSHSSRLKSSNRRPSLSSHSSNSANRSSRQRPPSPSTMKL
ncbi:deSI-like protein At4g17486 isoform X2 [Cornus florida]|uniref:deSI-like protein At4g17486 isoform X2 n=1 Tax=Cornus florida TaxID=4283 RepID=UPI0028A20367|nr:deSI-like protein At4g17486 isoform X2 [Cornus florida]